jgi:hypothetical protein
MVKNTSSADWSIIFCSSSGWTAVKAVRISRDVSVKIC